jgi:hypothetical protein
MCGHWSWNYRGLWYWVGNERKRFSIVFSSIEIGNNDDMMLYRRQTEALIYTMH